MDDEFNPIIIFDLNDLNLDTNLLRSELNGKTNKPTNLNSWTEILQPGEDTDNSDFETTRQSEESVDDVGLDEEKSTNERKRDNSKSSGNSRDVRKRITEDSEGTVLTKSQQEFFKDTKFVDENGNLLRLYHGTQQGGFTVFNTKAIFLTDVLDVSKTYTFRTEISILVVDIFFLSYINMVIK